MTRDETRRFTDREVALVLEKATALDEARTSSGGKGLSLADLEQIAVEVGISPDSIRHAVDSLDGRRGARAGVRAAPLTHRAVHAVPGTLDQEAMARLIRLVDERTSQAGAVTEALGTVRWTSAGESSVQVSIAPHGDETVIQVVEKAEARVRLGFHLVPASMSLPFSLPIAGALGLGGGPFTAVAVGVGLALGAAVGRVAWNLRSARSARRTEELAAELSRAAEASLETS